MWQVFCQRFKLVSSNPTDAVASATPRSSFSLARRSCCRILRRLPSFPPGLRLLCCDSSGALEEHPAALDTWRVLLFLFIFQLCCIAHELEGFLISGHAYLFISDQNHIRKANVVNHIWTVFAIYGSIYREASPLAGILYCNIPLRPRISGNCFNLHPVNFLSKLGQPHH